MYFQTRILSVSFIATVILSIFIIPILRKLKVGQIEREEGPQSHYNKKGTPTMGGIIIALRHNYRYNRWMLILFDERARSRKKDSATFIYNNRIWINRFYR